MPGARLPSGQGPALRPRSRASAGDQPGLPHPAPALGVIQAHEFLIRPVEVVREHGYLLVKLVEGVAADSPVASTSTSNGRSQCGHSTFSADVPEPLIRL